VARYPLPAGQASDHWTGPQESKKESRDYIPRLTNSPMDKKPEEQANN